MNDGPPRLFVTGKVVQFLVFAAALPGEFRTAGGVYLDVKVELWEARVCDGIWKPSVRSMYGFRRFLKTLPKFLKIGLLLLFCSCLLYTSRCV